MSLYQARSAYRQLRSEPSYYKEKVLGQVSSRQINVDYPTLESYQGEIDRLQNDIRSWKRRLDTIANRQGKRYREDRNEARELRTQFTQLASTLAEVKTNIGRTITAFQATDRQLVQAAGQLDLPTARLATAPSPTFPRFKSAALGVAKLAEMAKTIVDTSTASSYNMTQLDLPNYLSSSDNPSTGGPQPAATTPPPPAAHSPADLEKVRQAAAEKIFQQLRQKSADDMSLSINFNDMSEPEKQAMILKIKEDYLQTDPSGAVFLTVPVGVLYKEVVGNTFIPNDEYGSFWRAYEHNIFWYEGDILKSQQTIGDPGRDKVINAVALYNISQLTNDQYRQQGLTFTAYGIPWFNVPKYETIMAKTTTTEQDKLDFEQIANYIQANSTGTNREYLLEQLIMHSMDETTVISPESNAPDYAAASTSYAYKQFTLSPAFISLTKEYNTETGNLLDKDGVININDVAYRNKRDEFNRRLATNGFLTAISYNCNRLTMQMNWWQPGEYNKISGGKTVEDILKGSPLIDVEHQANGDELPIMVFTIPNEIYSGSTSSKSKIFTVYPATGTLSDAILTELESHLIQKKGDAKTDFLKTVGVSFFENIGGAQWEILQDIPAYAFEQILNAVPGAGAAYGLTSDTIKAVLDLKEENAFVDKMLGNVNSIRDANTFLLSGQVTTNADGTRTINIRRSDEKQLDYNLYVFYKEKEGKFPLKTADELAKEAAEHYKNGGKAPTGSYLDAYQVWAAAQGDINLTANWNSVQENIDQYNMLSTIYDLSQGNKKDITTMTPEEIWNFKVQWEALEVKSDNGEVITKEDLAHIN